MTDPAELTVENSALMLIDHQPWVAFQCEGVDIALVNNVTNVTRAAKALDVPTVLSTVGAEGSVLTDPIFTQIAAVFPDVTPIDSPTTAAWSDPNFHFRSAVEATGRQKLIMAGLSTRGPPGPGGAGRAQGRVLGLLPERLLSGRHSWATKTRSSA